MAISSPLSSRQTVAALLTLTAVTGLVDAVSYLRLGRVFVANMTGSVVFLGAAKINNSPGDQLTQRHYSLIRVRERRRTRHRGVRRSDRQPGSRPAHQCRRRDYAR